MGHELHTYYARVSFVSLIRLYLFCFSRKGDAAQHPRASTSVSGIYEPPIRLAPDGWIPERGHERSKRIMQLFFIGSSFGGRAQSRFTSCRVSVRQIGCHTP